MNRYRKPGLKELIAAAAPGECPFCGDPCKRRDEDGPGRPSPAASPGYYLTCCDPECADVAYNRYWKRDNYRAQKKRDIESRLRNAESAPASA